MSNINTKGFIVAAISIVVSVILVVGCLIPVITDSLGTERTVLYTNEGNYYYNTVTNSTSTTLSFTILDGDPEWPFSTMLMSINGGEAEITELPSWTSEQSFDFNALPLFTFITNDGKYGIEGIASIGLEDMDGEYIKKGGLMYFRMIQGSVPELHYMVDSLGEISVTLSNGSVSYVFQTEDVPTQLNGTYLLNIVDGTTGEYTLINTQTNHGPTVLDSTKFYMADWIGAVSIESDVETGDPYVVLGEAAAVGGYGTIADYSDLSNLSVYDFERSNFVSAVMNTTPAETGDGKILEYLIVTDENDTEYDMPCFIVPVEIAVGGETEMSPVLRSMITIIPLIVVIGLIMGTVGYFLRKQ